MARLQAMARIEAAAEAWQSELFRREAGAAQRLAAADRAYQEGNVRLATAIYVRLAGSKPAGPSTATARERLAKLAEEARQKLKAVDARLVPEAVTPEAGKSANSPTPTRLAPETILQAFEDYDEIASQYGKVPEVKRELASHISRQRRKAEYAAVLNETQAKELWEMGQRHERDDQACCAYWAYEQAARLVPAESALRAKWRFEAMKLDPNVVEAAKTCRELRRCHEVYHRATMMAKVKPERAKELYAEILRRAPADSAIYRTAQADLDALGNNEVR
jgi:hypothetical protein